MAGKTSCGIYLAERGFTHIEASDYTKPLLPGSGPVRERCLAREGLYEAFGADLAAQGILNSLGLLSEDSLHRVVITGTRTWEDIELLRASGFRVNIIAIYRPLPDAFEAGLRRGRRDHPREFVHFVLLFAWETKIGLGKIMWEADRLIVNGGTEQELWQQVHEIIMLDSVG